MNISVFRLSCLATSVFLALAPKFASAAPASTPAIVAWGTNSNGPIGDSTFTDRPLPVDITRSGLLRGKTVIQLEAGLADTLALCSDGSLLSWGYNLYGQLGKGTFSDGENLPQLISAKGALKGKKVVQIAAGYLHNLALCSDGTLAVWGDTGQVGQAASADKSLPANITGSGALAGKTITQIVSGMSQSAALCSDGSVVFWGDAGFAGNDPSVNPAIPTLFNNKGALAGKTVTRLSAGNSFTLALCSDNSIVAWGFDDKGQLGYDGPDQKGQPVLVAKGSFLNGKTVTQIAASFGDGYAVCSDGTVAAWGDNSAGQIGDGTTTTRTLPANITGKGALAGKKVTQISSRGLFALALCSDGTVASWGRGSAGQLGDGTTANRSLPAAITSQGALAGKKATTVVGAFDHGLALATAPPDTTKPAVVINTPVSGQSLLISAFNGATISGTATDNLGVAKVLIKLYRTRNGANQIWNGTTFGTTAVTVPADLSGTGQSITWKMGQEAPPQSQLDAGAYQFIIYAYDDAGNSATTRTIFSLTSSTPDTTKPTISISTPTANQTLLISSLNADVIKGVVGDNGGVAKVDLKLYRERDGVNQIWNGTAFTTTSTTVTATLTGSGTSIIWKMSAKTPPVSQLDAGVYQLIAYATDSAGNSSSTRVTFTLSDSAAAPVATSGSGGGS